MKGSLGIMKVCLLLLVSVLTAVGLTKEEVKNLVKMPHSRENLVKELKLFPDAREYRAKMKFTYPGKEPVDVTEIQVKEKVVKGKYLISQLEVGDSGELILVVEFDQDEGVYIKWVLLPAEDAEVKKMVGVGDMKSRTIAWTAVGGPDGFSLVSLEQQGEKVVTWSEIYLMDGKVTQRNEGEAVKLK